jgi:hypothetical protein
VLLAAPIRANEIWTMDFLHDALASGRKLRTLSIEDAYTHEMLAIEVDTSLPVLRVMRVLEKLRVLRGLPVRIVIDHGTEFTSRVLDQWGLPTQRSSHFITSGRPSFPHLHRLDGGRGLNAKLKPECSHLPGLEGAAEFLSHRLQAASRIIDTGF